MTIDAATASVVIGITALVGGFLAWWFAKVLSERKEDITQSLILKYLGEDVKTMKADIAEIKKRLEIVAIIEEKLKHLK